MTEGPSDPPKHKPQTEVPQRRPWPYDYEISISLPPELIFHHIEDSELERLAKGSKPVISGVALTCLGIFFGAIGPGLAGFVNLLNRTALSVPEIASMFITVGAIIGVLVAGPIALSLRHERILILERARNRTTVALPLGQTDRPTSDPTRKP